MPSFGPMELLLILVIVLVIFGAGRLPQVFSSLGKGIKEFREASEGDDKNAPTAPPPPGAAQPPATPTMAGPTMSATPAPPPPASGTETKK